MVTKRTIAQCKQNRVSLIVDDLAYYVEKDVAYEILLRRGAFKWFACRRDLIRLKDALRWWAKQEQFVIRCAKAEGDRYQLARARGALAMLEMVRRRINAICKSPRWRAQDNDRRAQKWLGEYEETAGQGYSLAPTIEEGPWNN